MADDATQSNQILGVVGGWLGGPQDTSGAGKLNAVSISQSGLTFPGLNAPLVPRLTPYNHYHQYPDVSSSLIAFSAGPGSTNYIAGPMVGDNPTNIANQSFLSRYGAIGSINPFDQPYPRSVGPLPPQPFVKDGAPVDLNNDNKPFTVAQDILPYNTYYGKSPDERNVKWDQKTDIVSPDSPFGSIPSLGMLQGLPGMIMSLASSFAGLSKQQKQKIKSNTSNQMYSLIEVTMTNAVDVGSYQKVSLQHRVHKETFANNMVDILCSCQTPEDLRQGMYELRSNTMLHGKDQLGTVEYRVPGLYGETGLIIDSHGNYKQNISPEVANAYANFTQFITQDIHDVEITCEFEGTITGNTMDVIRINFGNLQTGNTYYIEGYDVTDNTYIASFGTNANGNTGIYNLNLSSNTVANNTMVMYRIVTHADEKRKKQGGGGGGGGLGGLIGMGFANIFGEASQLLGEMMPCHDPVASSRILNNLRSVQSHVTPGLYGLIRSKLHGLIQGP